jgi:hypothetical protein
MQGWYGVCITDYVIGRWEFDMEVPLYARRTIIEVWQGDKSTKIEEEWRRREDEISVPSRRSVNAIGTVRKHFFCE